MRRIVWIWLPVLIWAGFIFCFSTDQFSSGKTFSSLGKILDALFPFLSPEQNGQVHFMIRKLGHWSEYFIFGWLVYRAALGSGWEESNPLFPWKTLSLVLIWALLDEFHQLFVPSRSASLKDSLLDFVGGYCAVALIGLKLQAASRRHLHENSWPEEKSGSTPDPSGGG